MKFAAISDVHVKVAGDPAENLLITFLRNPDVQHSDVIFLLGDIFDLMIGPHSQYFTRFQTYFDEIKKLIRNGKRICYVEGNHDFHLRELYKKFFKVNSDLDSSLFQMAPYFEFENGGKKVYLAHGDDIELNNPNYKLFKSIVTSPPLRYYANNLMPHFLIKSIGEYSSEKSRKRNNKRYKIEADLTPVRDNFRKSSESFFKSHPFEILVLGHSHVKDQYQSDLGFEYVNNGYAQHTKTYISIEDGNVSFKSV
ncbi:MAG: UDP-2,3-diacylglucosamine diphosphatase [Bdellovibrionales bacterium]|nr:UDP-2,3-diacylglucosamine diphosphatase [Bdellovibrionales bacterium]